MADVLGKPRIFKRNGWWFVDYVASNPYLLMRERVVFASHPQFSAICHYARQWQHSQLVQRGN